MAFVNDLYKAYSTRSLTYTALHQLQSVAKCQCRDAQRQSKLLYGCNDFLVSTRLSIEQNSTCLLPELALTIPVQPTVVWQWGNWRKVMLISLEDRDSIIRMIQCLHGSLYIQTQIQKEIPCSSSMKGDWCVLLFVSFSHFVAWHFLGSPIQQQQQPASVYSPMTWSYVRSPLSHYHLCSCSFF